MYDIFYISHVGDNDSKFDKIKTRYPTAQIVSNVTCFDDVRKKSFTKMFWVIWDDVELDDNFDLTEYRATKWDDTYTHVFKNGEYYDGICLFSKHAQVSSKEFENRFFVNKKQINIQASTPKPYDIVFISYNEPNAEANYKSLKNKVPNVKRVDKVKGIHQAHIKAASLVETDMFWAVDGDAVILDNFDFSYRAPSYEKDTVHVWRSQNPINDLEYGYGGVKLLPRKLTLEMSIDTADMTTSISKKFKAMPEISNLTEFNTDPFNAWKSAFRECVKLSSKIINGQVSSETEFRLMSWCTKGKDSPFGEYAIDGAISGKNYGETYKNDPARLSKINDFEWLKSEFSKYYE